MTQDLDGSLNIKGVIDSDEGKYQCLAKNFAGTRTSSEGILLMQGKLYLQVCNPCIFFIYIFIYIISNDNPISVSLYLSSETVYHQAP